MNLNLYTTHVSDSKIVSITEVETSKFQVSVLDKVAAEKLYIEEEKYMALK
jgi:hypothetical protein